MEPKNLSLRLPVRRGNFSPNFSVGISNGLSITPQGSQPMHRATGVGGIFFKARNPDSLRAWYQRHLGTELWQPPAGQ